MIVTVKCFTGMRRYAPAMAIDAFPVRLERGARVRDLLTHLGAAEQKAVLTAVNDRRAGPDDILQDGAQVILFTPVEGG
jgi:molybdopterin converting factor small subunit